MLGPVQLGAAVVGVGAADARPAPLLPVAPLVPVLLLLLEPPPQAARNRAAKTVAAMKPKNRRRPRARPLSLRGDGSIREMTDVRDKLAEPKVLLKDRANDLLQRALNLDVVGQGPDHG